MLGVLIRGDEVFGPNTETDKPVPINLIVTFEYLSGYAVYILRVLYCPIIINRSD